MAVINKHAILNVLDLKRERVPVPEWGEGAEVIIQEMSALDRSRLQAEMLAEEGTTPVNVAARVLVRCIICEDGGRMFVDEEAEALGRKSVAVINRLFAVAQRLNVMAPDMEEAAKK